MTRSTGPKTRAGEADALDPRKLEMARRLKNLRDHQATSIHEAANAAARLQALLLEHNIDEATIDHLTGAKAVYGRQMVDFSGGGGVESFAWKSRLLNTVGQHNNVKIVQIMDERSNKRAPLSWMVGQRQNITVVRHLYAYLAAEIIRLGERDWPKHDAEARGRSRKAFLEGFYSGAVDEIYRRLKAQRAEDEKEHAEQWGLVLVKGVELSQATAAFFSRGLVKGGREGERNKKAYAMGREAAKGIGLDKPLNQSRRAEALEAGQ